MITTVYADLRKQILTACIKNQQLLLDDFSSRIRNILTHEGLGNEDEYDNTELAQASQRAAEIDALNESMKFVAADLNTLHYLGTLTDVVHTTPEPGAIVVTSRGKFFVSVSAGQVSVNGETFTALSAGSRLFLAMKDKHAGDTFEFGKNRYKIQQIF